VSPFDRPPSAVEEVGTRPFGWSESLPGGEEPASQVAQVPGIAGHVHRGPPDEPAVRQDPGGDGRHEEPEGEVPGHLDGQVGCVGEDPGPLQDRRCQPDGDEERDREHGGLPAGPTPFVHATPDDPVGVPPPQEWDEDEQPRPENSLSQVDDHWLLAGTARGQGEQERHGGDPGDAEDCLDPGTGRARSSSPGPRKRPTASANPSPPAPLTARRPPPTRSGAASPGSRTW
jgi:hypothetical protein